MQLLSRNYPSRAYRTPRTHCTLRLTQHGPARVVVYQPGIFIRHRPHFRPCLCRLLFLFLPPLSRESFNLQIPPEEIQKPGRKLPFGHSGRQQHQYGGPLSSNGGRSHHRFLHKRLFQQSPYRPLPPISDLPGAACKGARLPPSEPYGTSLLLPSLHAQP